MATNRRSVLLALVSLVAVPVSGAGNPLPDIAKPSSALAHEFIGSLPEWDGVARLAAWLNLPAIDSTPAWPSVVQWPRGPVAPFPGLNPVPGKQLLDWLQESEDLLAISLAERLAGHS